MSSRNRLRSRLQLESLEDRAVPAVVHNIGPGDVAALLDAVTAANTNFEEDTINLAPGATYILSRTLEFQAARGFRTTINGNGATLTLDSAGPKFPIVLVRDFEKLSVDRVTITNGSSLFGGGIFVSSNASVTVTNSTISHNAAIKDSITINSGAGGGIFIGENASLTITNSTISDNSASSQGAGIFALANASVAVANSTISGNHAGSDGGGIYIQNSAFAIRNSTIAFNSADHDNQIGGDGGGIFVGNGSSVTLQSTIVADNLVGLTGSFADIAGFVMAGNCLIGNIFGTTLANGSVANVTGQDPLLAPLANNGGPTQTHALSAGSPAIDIGSNPQGLSFDQRGSGFARVLGAGVDIGAFEATPPEPPPPTTTGSIGFGAATFSGSEGGGPVTITLVRSGGSAGSLTVDLNATGGSGDFSGVPTTVTFADGQTTASVPLPIVDDALVEGPETFSLSLTGTSVGTPATATLEITDNDAAPPPPPPPPLQKPPAPAPQIFHYLPFIQSPRGLKFAVADVTNDGVSDLLIARKGRGPAVVVDGATGQMTLVFILGYHPGFGDGVLLGGLDTDGDGLPNFFVGLSGVRLY